MSLPPVVGDEACSNREIELELVLPGTNKLGVLLRRLDNCGPKDIAMRDQHTVMRQQSLARVNDRSNVLLEPRQHPTQIRNDDGRWLRQRDLGRQLFKKLDTIRKAVFSSGFTRQ